MRITIEVTDVTPGQWEWLLDNVRNDYGHYDVRMCVTFVSGNLTVHRELPAAEWVRLIERLNRIGQVAEAVLTPDVSWGAVPRRAYHELREQHEGYSGL